MEVQAVKVAKLPLVILAHFQKRNKIRSNAKYNDFKSCNRR